MRARTFLLILLSLSLFACGNHAKGPRSGQTDFSDGDSGKNPPPKAGADEASSRETVNPTPEQIQRQLELDAQLLRQDKQAEVTVYQTPEVIRDRLRETRPDLVVESGKHFTIDRPFLDISSRQGVMTFTGVLKIQGIPDENLELRCRFDKTKTPWSCNDMYPTNASVAAQRRLQATVSCADNHRWEMDSYPCEDVGIEIYVVVNGKTESQLFQTRRFSMRIASSGDEEVEENPDNLKTLENPIPAGPRVQQRPGEPTLSPIDPISAERPTSQEAPLTAIDPISAERPKPTQTQIPAPAPTPTRSPRPVAPPPIDTDIVFAPPDEPTPVAPIIFAPPPNPAEELSDVEILEIIDDPNIALEITAPIPQPRPDQGPQSIPGIALVRPTLPDVERIETEVGVSVRDQAQGTHNNGSLRQAAQMPQEGEGFVSRDHGSKDYGADIMIDLLKGASKNSVQVNPSGPRIVVGSIAKRTGGCLPTGTNGRCHASHRNGLDADIGFPSTSASSATMWPACNAVRLTRQVRRMGRMEERTGTFCPVGGQIADEFDEERFWAFTKSIVCAANDPVIAMFLDPEIKKHMCRWVAAREDLTNPNSCAYKTLRAMKDEPGHHNHVHIRLRCPGNRGCLGQDSIVTLGSGTGC